MSRAVKIVVNALIEDMRNNPKDYRCGEHTLDNTETGMQYWVSNGFPFAAIYAPYKLSFGWWHGWRFHQALKAWKAVDMLSTLQEGEG